MVISIVRVLSIVLTLVLCLGLALAAGLILARLGYLGTCQDGTCELVAVIYVTPLVGTFLYLLALVLFSIVAMRKHGAEKQ